MCFLVSNTSSSSSQYLETRHFMKPQVQFQFVASNIIGTYITVMCRVGVRVVKLEEAWTVNHAIGRQSPSWVKLTNSLQHAFNPKIAGSFGSRSKIGDPVYRNNIVWSLIILNKYLHIAATCPSFSLPLPSSLLFLYTLLNQFQVEPYQLMLQPPALYTLA